MRFPSALALVLVACSGPVDINGTYNGTMTRSQGCGNPPPATASAQVQIVDGPSEHVVHILGAQPCDLDFTVTDYGGVGYVSDVRPGCAFQPPGMVLGGGPSDFGPSHIELRWTTATSDAGAADGGATSCQITDSWSLTR